MGSPGMVLGAVLFISSACSISALDLFLDISIKDNEAVIDGRALDLPEAELLKAMDSGATVRLTWVFRLGGSDESVVLFARRDPLGEGYIIYGTDPYGPKSPVPSHRLMLEFSTLDSHTLSLGPWPEATPLEACLYLDRELHYPPVSLSSLFRGGRERSGWRSFPRPGTTAR